MPKKKEPARPAPAAAAFDAIEFLRHPSLALGCLAAALALCSLILTFRFRHDLAMGAVREPTGMILWAGIAGTLFASFARERKKSGA